MFNALYLCYNVCPMAILADPLSRGARAISFAPFCHLPTPSHRTRVVLVLLSGVANPLSVLIPRRMRRSIHELVDCTNHILLCRFLLGKIMVLNQLPCKLCRNCWRVGTGSGRQKKRLTRKAFTSETASTNEKTRISQRVVVMVCSMEGSK